MTRHFSPIDRRPFQSKAKLEQQESLVARYGAIAIPELAAAIKPAIEPCAPAAEAPRSDVAAAAA
ncbi:MAG TPA: hypothetical protein VG894_04060 [Bauldia sp.]|nr:hypothetical protein [Bauldia sp.]